MSQTSPRVPGRPPSSTPGGAATSAPIGPSALGTPPRSPGPDTLQPASAAHGATPAAATAPATASVATSDTPRRLRLLSLGTVVVGVAIGLLGALTFGFLAYSLNRAEADVAQLIRVQKIQTNLLGADATATNAFLVGGLEPPGQRAAYDQAMTDTASLIATAARAQPADAEALAALNQQVLGYAAVIEQARANNRQGFPVGAQYLRIARAELRSSALPTLDNLVSANAQRAQDEMRVGFAYGFAVVALLGLGGLVAAQVWVARRFRRTINTGLLAASVVLLVVLVGGLIGVRQLDSAVTSVRTGSFAAVNAAAEARIEANNAKSNESLTLVARGSGQAFEKAWQASAGGVAANLAQLAGQPGLTDLWTGYTKVHASIRKLDDGGSWDKAVSQATGTGADSSNTVFGAFDAALADYLGQVGSATSSSLARQQPGLVVGAVLLLLAGLGAALLGRAGIAVRLREYR